MKLAAEPQLHCADGDPLLVLDAANHAMATFRVAEAAAGSSEQRLELRCGVMLLRARALHVAGKTQEALRNAYMTLLWLENIAEGPRSLAAALSDPQPNAVARQTVATVAVLAPAARRTTFAPKLRDHLVDVCRYYASAYVDSRAPVYPATAALAAQVFYLLISEARTDDADLIRMLYDLDERTRPDDTCGRITRPLRDLALATYQGNRLASEHFAREAAACLERMSLVRHQGVLAELRASWR
jgi:hypothetical protein